MPAQFCYLGEKGFDRLGESNEVHKNIVRLLQERLVPRTAPVPPEVLALDKIPEEGEGVAPLYLLLIYIVNLKKKLYFGCKTAEDLTLGEFKSTIALRYGCFFRDTPCSITLAGKSISDADKIIEANKTEGHENSSPQRKNLVLYATSPVRITDAGEMSINKAWQALKPA